MRRQPFLKQMMNDNSQSVNNKPRSTRVLLLGGVAILVVAGVVGWLLGHRASAPQNATAQSEAQVGGASEDAHARGAADYVATDRTSPAASSPPTIPKDQSAMLLGFPSLSIEQVKGQQLQKQHRLESSFAKDPADPSAATLELGMLKAMMDPALTGDRLAPGNPQVKCHQTSCRISADFSSSDDASSWAVNYLTMLGGKLGSTQPTMTVGPDGSVRMELYGTRLK